LLVVLCIAPGCSDEEQRAGEVPARSNLEGRLQPAPAADIEAVTEAVQEPAGPRSRPWVFRWPLRDVDITSPYGIRMHPVVRRLLFHSGVDFRAPRGEPVLAVGPGRVQQAGRMRLTGLTVVLRHPGGLTTLYAHLDERLVFEGQRVAGGAPVGLVGSTGRSTGPHLHFAVYRQVGKSRHPLDPAEFVGRLIEPAHPPRPALPPRVRAAGSSGAAAGH
jgi:murein DD-endopeptidase MepM/ murein hydrolase activator NlpD